VAGVDVDFEIRKTGFAVVFHRVQIHNFTQQVTGQVIGQIKGQVIGQDTSQDASKDTSEEQRVQTIIDFCSQARTRNEIQKFIGISNRAYFSREILKPLLDSGNLSMTIPNKPNSKNQKYIKIEK